MVIIGGFVWFGGNYTHGSSLLQFFLWSLPCHPYLGVGWLMNARKKAMFTHPAHRSNLETAQAALEATQTNLSLKESELREARLSMTDTSTRLNESERNISQLRENR